MIVIAARAAREGRLPLVGRRPERGDEEAGEDGERRRLRGDRHERGDRGRGALVDVRRPLVEGRDRDLEGEADGDERDPDQDQRVVGEVGADALSDRREVGGAAGAAVDEGRAVEQGRRADRADDQVLEPRLERLRARAMRAAEHVERDREQLEGDEERDQVLGLREQDHPEHRPEQQRVRLAEAGLLGGGIAELERDHERRRGDHDQADRQREPVAAERAGDEVGVGLAELPDHQPGGGAEGQQRQRRGQPAPAARPDQPDEEDDDDPRDERDDRRERRVVDVRGVDHGALPSATGAYPVQPRSAAAAASGAGCGSGLTAARLRSTAFSPRVVIRPG